jgi:uncharacterized protein YneR
MKKLLIISSALIAFSAVNLFANDNSNSNGQAQAISGYNQATSDTVPKKDTTKKKTDSLTFQVNEKK